MQSIKPGRWPSAMGAIVGIFMVIFGIAGIVMLAMADGGTPVLFRIFAVLFCVVFVGTSIAMVIYHFHNATNKNRLSAFDITSPSEENDSFHGRVGVPPRAVAPGTTEDKLQELEILRDRGLITEAEYTAQRKRILDSI